MNSFATAARRAALAFGLFAGLIVLFGAAAPPASAQTMTFYYTGQPYVNSYCMSDFSVSCSSGAITASVTLKGVSPSFGGGVSTSAVASYAFDAGGVGSLSNLIDLYAGYFNIYYGQVTYWYFQADNYAQVGAASDLGIYSTGPSQSEDAYQRSMYAFVAAGAGPTATTANGVWINPKVLGPPAPLPRIADPTPANPAEPAAKPDFCPCTSLAQVGDPVDVSSGNVYEEATDYHTVGQNPLSFIRHYNSMGVPDTYATTLGPKWRSNYDRYLHIVSSSGVEVERPNGQIINFDLVSAVWKPDTDVDMTLTNSGSTWTLTDHDGVVETYTASSGKAVLNSIAWPNGYTQTMNYTSGVLTSVSDSYSRSLSFTYTSGMLTGVSTPDSLVLSYGYTTVNGQSLLTSVSYNTSPSTSQTYVYGNSSYPFALTGITDENGNSFASWSYDTIGRASMSEHAGSAGEVQVSYDDSTGNRTVTGPLGNVETYKFTLVQGVEKVSEIDRTANSPVASASRYFTYDGNGYLATATDWNGNSTHYTNDSHGDPTSITEAYGAGVARTTTISYDSTWVQKPYTITKTGVTIDDRYDSGTGNLLTHTLTDTTGGATNGQTHVWTYTYNGTGELLTAQMPRTGTTVKNTYTYTAGTLTSITDQLSHATTISSYTGGGLPLTVVDPNSVTTTLTYDNRNRLLTKTIAASPTNEVTTYSYIASGQPYVVTLPDSSTTTYTYDNAQRVTKIANTAGETINYTLNDMGKPTAVAIKDSGGTTRKSWTATYDVLGDMLTMVGSGGGSQTTSYSYDGQQNRTGVTDANSETWAQAWDALNRASTVTDPLTHTAAPTYNARDEVTAQTDFNGYSTSFTRDAFGNAIGVSSPDTGSASSTFDEDNNLTARTDGRSVASAQTFDAVDRISARSFTGYSGEAIAYTYDSTASGNKGVGRLTSVTDESGSTALTYNNFGNITQEVRVIGSQTYTTSYSYDLANRLTEIIYPSGRYVDYTYDSSGYLTTVTTKPSSGGSVTTLASSITHKPFGPVASFTYGNSEAQTRTYDNNYWLDDLVTTYSGTDIQNLTYGFDNAGNLTSITDNMAAGRDEAYGVDALNRLHTASGAYGSRTYTYDSNSNRSTWYDGTTTKTSHYASGTNLPGTITFGSSTRTMTWSGSGNMATDDRVGAGALATSYTYGGRDRLESMSVNSQPITFKINALGERVSKATVGGTTHFHYDLGHRIIAESNGSTGATTMEYVWLENLPLAQIDSSGNIVYIHTDQTGNPEKITNPSRTIVWDREQEPFGETYATPTNTTPTNHRFPGQYADVEDSLSYNLNRDYDSTLGRYVQADPLGFGGGYNFYGYASQNPVRFVDPLGLDGAPVTPVEKTPLASPTIPGTNIPDHGIPEGYVPLPGQQYNPYDPHADDWKNASPLLPYPVPDPSTDPDMERAPPQYPLPRNYTPAYSKQECSADPAPSATPIPTTAASAAMFVSSSNLAQ